MTTKNLERVSSEEDFYNAKPCAWPDAVVAKKVIKIKVQQNVCMDNRVIRNQNEIPNINKGTPNTNSGGTMITPNEESTKCKDCFCATFKCFL